MQMNTQYMQINVNVNQVLRERTSQNEQGVNMHKVIPIRFIHSYNQLKQRTNCLVFSRISEAN